MFFSIHAREASHRKSNNSSQNLGLHNCLLGRFYIYTYMYVCMYVWMCRTHICFLDQLRGWGATSSPNTCTRVDLMRWIKPRVSRRRFELCVIDTGRRWHHPPSAIIIRAPHPNAICMHIHAYGDIHPHVKSVKRPAPLAAQSDTCQVPYAHR